MSRFLTTSEMEAEKEHKISVFAKKSFHREAVLLGRQPDSRALVIFLQLAVIFFFVRHRQDNL